tara:strand:+ start:3157 stop:3411 length:255 start_codon:yes stop_codon:yes gene_type:complete
MSKTGAWNLDIVENSNLVDFDNSELETMRNVLQERLELAEMYDENLVEKIVYHPNSMFGVTEEVLNDSFKPEQDLLTKINNLLK